MNPDDALALVNQLVTDKTGKPLDTLQTVVFKGSWEGESYNQIAINNDYSDGHLKAVGSNLWVLLSEVLERKVTKKNFRLVIENNYSNFNLPLRLPVSNPLLRREDWGNAPNIDENKFFGRENELESLKDSIINKKRRLVSIWGMAGIGKTTLAVKLAKDIKDNFDYIIWRSLENAPPFNDLMQDIILFLSDGQKTDLPEKRNEKINVLRKYLRLKRCLVIIDNVDGIPQNDETEQWKEKYQDYHDVLTLFNQPGHELQPGDSHSCLLLTSREKLPGVEQLERKNIHIPVLNLEGLETEGGKQIFESIGTFKGSQEQWTEVITHYAGNPKALELVAPLVENFYHSDLSELIEHLNDFHFDDLRDLLNRQYEKRLPKLPLGKEIIYWLAIGREPVQLSTLVEDMFLSREGDIINCLYSLVKFSMIESRESGYYTLHPFVREYFIEQFIEEICNDIQNYKNIENYQDLTLNRYALKKAQSKSYIRESQITFVLDPVIKELKKRLGNKENIKKYLKQLILDLQNRFQCSDGYAAGNIIHILIRLEINLRGYDFSNLTIWQAYLSKVNLCQVNFSNSIFNNPTNSKLHNCVFADILHGVFSVAFSKDSNFVAAGDLNGQIHIWNVEQFKKHKTLQDEDNISLVWSIAFHPTEKKIATGNDDHTIRLWDAETSIIIGEHENKSVHSVCFNSDGKILASSSADNTIKLWYWNCQTGKYELHQTLEEHDNAVWCIAFNCDGILASGSDDNTIKLWKENPDTGNWETYHTFEGHTDHVRSVAFHPDGKLLASGSQDETVRLWNIETKKSWILEGHKGWIWSVAFNPDSQTLASCGEDQIIKIWNLETKSICSSLIGHDHAVRSIAFNHNGTILFSGSYDQSVKLWEWNKENNQGQCIRTRQGIASAFRSIAFSPDGNFLASGGGDKIVRLWDLKTQIVDNNQEQKLKEEHGTWIWSVAFSSDGKTLASCSDDKTLKLWNITDINNPRILQREPFNEQTRTVAFSPDENLLAIGSNDGRVTLFKRNASTERWDRREIPKEHSNWVWSVAFSPDSKILASCGDDGRINLWKIQPQTVEHFRTLEQDKHQGMVYSLAFSTYNNKIILASGSADNTIKLWDVETGECLKSLKKHSHWVWSVAFSPDGKILASGSADCTVKLWDVETGKCLCNLDISEEPDGHTQWVRTVAISKDGKFLASAGDDQMIKLWNIEDINNVKFLRNLKPESPYQGMIITDVTGLSDARKEILRRLGAIE